MSGSDWLYKPGLFDKFTLWNMPRVISCKNHYQAKIAYPTLSHTQVTLKLTLTLTLTLPLTLVPPSLETTVLCVLLGLMNPNLRPLLPSHVFIYRSPPAPLLIPL